MNHRLLSRAIAPLFVLAGYVLVGRASDTSDWPQFRGPNHDGTTQEKNWSDQWPDSGPKRIWKADVGTGFSAVSVARGAVYTMGNRGNMETIYCFDAASGAPLWKHSYSCPTDPKYYEGGPSATPTILDGKVYTFSRQGHAYCLDAKSGHVVWLRNLAESFKLEIPTWGFAGSPYVEGKYAVFNAGSGGVCLDSSTGEVIWKSGPGPSGYSTPVPHDYDGKKCLLLFGSKSVFAVQLENGRRVWDYPWVTEYDVNASDPVPFGDRVFISSGYDRGCSVIEISGSQTRKVWENKNLRSHFNSCLFVDGGIFGIDGSAGNDAVLRCLDPGNGDVKWSVDHIGTGGILASDGKLLVLGGQGELSVGGISLSGFTPKSHAQVIGGKCWTMPVLSQGRIYVRNARGDLVCLDARS